MAIGKGSMARAAKTNTKVTAPKAETPEVKQTEKEVVSKVTETATKKPAAKSTAKKTTKTAASKTTSVKTTKTTKTVKTTTKSVEKQADTKTSVLTPSEQVMEQIVYQKSAQVLDRDAKDNETFGVGDAMPVYFY